VSKCFHKFTVSVKNLVNRAYQHALSVRGTSDSKPPGRRQQALLFCTSAAQRTDGLAVRRRETSCGGRATHRAGVTPTRNFFTRRILYRSCPLPKSRRFPRKNRWRQPLP
jgi:hypothetical protein